MSQVKQTIKVAAAPDDVWKIVGDVGNIHTWIPPVVATTMDGDVRTATFADGGEARERIDSRSDQSRSYTYTYLDGSIPLDEYTSTITVTAHPDGTGSLVTWTAVLQAAPQVISSIDDMYVASLNELQSMFTR
jgi:carbon monoxide dehydrogenase subunit G